MEWNAQAPSQEMPRLSKSLVYKEPRQEPNLVATGSREYGPAGTRPRLLV